MQSGLLQGEVGEPREVYFTLWETSVPPGSPLTEWVRNMLAGAETNSVRVHSFIFLADIALLCMGYSWIVSLFCLYVQVKRQFGSLFISLSGLGINRVSLIFTCFLQCPYLRAGRLQVQYFQVLAVFRAWDTFWSWPPSSPVPPGAGSLQGQGHLLELAAFQSSTSRCWPSSGPGTPPGAGCLQGPGHLREL